MINTLQSTTAGSPFAAEERDLFLDAIKISRTFRKLFRSAAQHLKLFDFGRGSDSLTTAEKWNDWLGPSLASTGVFPDIKHLEWIPASSRRKLLLMTVRELTNPYSNMADRIEKALFTVQQVQAYLSIFPALEALWFVLQFGVGLDN